MVLMVSVLLPFSSQTVLAVDDEIKVSNYNQLKTALENSENKNKTILLTSNISGSSSAGNLTFKYPMTLNLNKKTLTIPNSKRIIVNLAGDEDVFTIKGRVSFDNSMGSIKGNYNGTLISLSKGNLVIDDVSITNNTTNANG